MRKSGAEPSGQRRPTPDVHTRQLLLLVIDDFVIRLDDVVGLAGGGARRLAGVRSRVTRSAAWRAGVRRLLLLVERLAGLLIGLAQLFLSCLDLGEVVAAQRLAR